MEMPQWTVVRSPDLLRHEYDSAYRRFLVAFSAVPDSALDYLPADDEYALGVLSEHLSFTLWSYALQLDAMLDANFTLVDLSEDRMRAAEHERRRAELVVWRPSPADRPPMLRRLETAHHHYRTQIALLDEFTFERKAPIIYAAGSQHYPTSARDITRWLTDHYAEHTLQAQDLLRRWRMDTARRCAGR
jgi:hypothetical protein